MTSANREVQPAVEFEGLNEQDQGVLDSFRGLHGRPILPRHPELAGRPNTKLRQAVARHKSRLAARLVSDPLVAIYNVPAKERSNDRKYFCEACGVSMPAREQDWQIHSIGIGHQCQLLSLCDKGELGHVPLGDSEAIAGTWQHVLQVTDRFCYTRLFLQAPTSQTM